VNSLTTEQVIKIAKEEMDGIGTFELSQPKSALIGYELKTGDKGTFTKYNVVILSPLVAEKVYTTYIRDLWTLMLRLGDAGGSQIFETYTRALMATGSKITFLARKCVGKGETYDDQFNLTLGGCSRIQRVHDLIRGAKSHEPYVLFHPIDRRYKLIDFLYKDGDNIFHAFQATLGATHTANVDAIVKLEKSVGGAKMLKLYYIVPSDKFATFLTDPVNPRRPVDPSKEQDHASCEIYHVMVSPDTFESSLLASNVSSNVSATGSGVSG
jgi:hypothetical protein